MSYEDCTLIGCFDSIESLKKIDVSEQLRDKGSKLFLIVRLKKRELKKLKGKKEWTNDDAVTLPPSVRATYNEEPCSLIVRITNYTVNVYDLSTKRALWTPGPLKETANTLIEMTKSQKELAKM